MFKFTNLILILIILTQSKPLYQCVKMPIKTAIEEHEVIPDVIKSIPRDTIEINYGSLEVKLGNVLTPTEVRHFPTNIKYPSKPDSKYTLAMVDPDAPSRKSPKFREWLHFLATNIAGDKVADGDVLAQFVPSGPPPNSGLHRYVWLVYEQPNGKINTDEKKLTNRSAEGRGQFSIDKFAKKYQLGNPVAINFYQAAYDDFVPELYKQLGEA